MVEEMFLAAKWWSFQLDMETEAKLWGDEVSGPVYSNGPFMVHCLEQNMVWDKVLMVMWLELQIEQKSEANLGGIN